MCVSCVAARKCYFEFIFCIKKIHTKGFAQKTTFLDFHRKYICIPSSLEAGLGVLLIPQKKSPSNKVESRSKRVL